MGDFTAYPTGQPSEQPTLQPFANPTGQPTKEPSTQPTSSPSIYTSANPSPIPSLAPSSASPTLSDTVLRVSTVTAAIVILAALAALCFVYFSCIRKTNAKDKIYALMDEAKLDENPAAEEKMDYEEDDDDYEDL